MGAGRKEKKKGESEREKRQANAFTAFKVDLIFKMHFWIMFSEPVSCSKCPAAGDRGELEFNTLLGAGGSSPFWFQAEPRKALELVVPSAAGEVPHHHPSNVGGGEGAS